MNRRTFFKKIGLLVLTPFISKFLISQKKEITESDIIDGGERISIPLHYDWKTMPWKTTIDINQPLSTKPDANARAVMKKIRNLEKQLLEIFQSNII